MPKQRPAGFARRATAFGLRALEGTMNFRLILTLALLGIAVGLGTTFGLVPPGWETLATAVVALIMAATLATRAPGRLFLHGLLAGAIGSALTSLTQAALLGQYLAHNPRAVEAFSRLPIHVSPAVLVVALSPLTAGFSGIVTGLLTRLWARFARRKPATALSLAAPADAPVRSAAASPPSRNSPATGNMCSTKRSSRFRRIRTGAALP